ncbi:hypothetical protein U1Q18_046361 [Sarracenia purpurea var. burkii]
MSRRLRGRPRDSWGVHRHLADAIEESRPIVEAGPNGVNEQGGPIDCSPASTVAATLRALTDRDLEMLDGLFVNDAANCLFQESAKVLSFRKPLPWDITLCGL